MKVHVSCGECGKGLRRWMSQLAILKYGAFCNRECLGKYRTRVLVGPLGANFQNGLKKDRDYIRVQAGWHPASDQTGYVSLHRLIFEARSGQFLGSGLVVHHKDGDPTNNHWDNLEAIPQDEHARKHLQEEGTRDARTGRIQKRSRT